MDDNITFITTSLFSKWQALSSQLVKKHFPKSNHIIVNGKMMRNKNSDWWFQWLKELKSIQTPYFCMLDEDCFLESREAIFEVIETLEKEGKSLAGVPDSFFSWRNYNSVCLNPFFMIGKTEDIKKATLKPFRHLRYNTKYKNQFEINWIYDKSKIIITEYEPFYCFFYAVLEQFKFLYLYPYEDYRFAYNRKYPATNPRLSLESNDLAVHMWWSRSWQSGANRQRYEKVEKYLNEKYENCLSY